MDGESKQLNGELTESETIKKFRCIMCPFNWNETVSKYHCSHLILCFLQEDDLESDLVPGLVRDLKLGLVQVSFVY